MIRFTVRKANNRNIISIEVGKRKTTIIEALLATILIWSKVSILRSKYSDSFASNVSKGHPTGSTSAFLCENYTK